MGTIENLIFSFLNLIADSFVNSAFFAIGVYLVILTLYTYWYCIRWAIAPLLIFRRTQQYVYRRIDKLYYVGTYTPAGKWIEESQWNTLKEAKERVVYLCKITKNS